MLRKDKALLENLTRKYGKNNVLNELEHRTISNAFRKAKELSRWQQARVFSDELDNRFKKNSDNLELELIFSGVDYEDYVVEFFINKDKNYPIAFVHNDGSEFESVGVVTSESYEDDLNEYYLKNILKKFNQLTNNNIQYKAENSFLYHIPQNDIKSLFGYKFNDKKTAIEFTNVANVLNDYFNSQLDNDWHSYHNQGSRTEYGFDERGNRIYESSLENLTRKYGKNNVLNEMKSNNTKSIKYLDDFQYAIKQGLEEGWEVSIYSMSDFDWFEKKYPKLERVLNAADENSKIAAVAENLIIAMNDFIEVVNDESIEKEYKKFAIPFMKDNYGEVY